MGGHRVAGIALAVWTIGATTRAHAETGTATLSAGAVHLDKRTPVELDTTSALVRIEGGLRLGPRTAARLRLEGFRADGVNLIAALVAEVDLLGALGAQGFAGLSAGSRSGLGNSAGAGLFGRWFIHPSYAVRADAFVSVAVRNDFGGYGLGLVAGLEWRATP